MYIKSLEAEKNAEGALIVLTVESADCKKQDAKETVISDFSQNSQKHMIFNTAEDEGMLDNLSDLISVDIRKSGWILSYPDYVNLEDAANSFVFSIENFNDYQSFSSRLKEVFAILSMFKL